MSKEIFVSNLKMNLAWPHACHPILFPVLTIIITFIVILAALITMRTAPKIIFVKRTKKSSKSDVFGVEIALTLRVISG